MKRINLFKNSVKSKIKARKKQKLIYICSCDFCHKVFKPFYIDLSKNAFEASSCSSIIYFEPRIHMQVLAAEFGSDYDCCTFLINKKFKLSSRQIHCCDFCIKKFLDTHDFEYFYNYLDEKSKCNEKYKHLIPKIFKLEFDQVECISSDNFKLLMEYKPRSKD